MRSLLLTVLLMSAWPSLASAEPMAPAAVLNGAVVNVIRPNMLRFDAASRGLDSAMLALCAVPSTDGLAIAAEQFGLVVRSYGKIDFVRIGPLLEDNRAERLLSAPDWQARARQEVEAMVSAQDGPATEVSGLQAKSADVQGLGALEYVLFGSGAESMTGPAGSRRCAYGRAIAANIAGMALDLAGGWYLPDGIAAHLQRPKADYGDYRSEVEAMEALVGLLSQGFASLREQQLTPIIASADGSTSSEPAVFSRSGLTMDFIRANIEGMHALMDQLAMAGSDQALGQAMDVEFERAGEALDRLDLPLAHAAADDTHNRALADLAIAISALQAMASETLPAALNGSAAVSSMHGN